ncbi:exodeoxyribonuclease VII large subunit [Apilactobacillus xinyiensis]|uniref:exodeoxyribonuclease VII large subunit n=1 Tax=Apilactobacillus xinyiensis TaxID=2841032 RepID=UPI00200D9B57|nr:exodeoxyribonuclease VII large subunit [Apilactobacillus xinyiensis]MCL0329454.1 exodeoxyribonuclease VII large subunit [Apilactobacillus xinyiensis]
MDNEYLTVTALTQYLKKKFDFDPFLGKIYLTGEISNYRYRGNSHQYFSIKDDNAKISAVMFKSAFAKVKFQPEEGMKVLVTGRISLYERSGSYQIYVNHMEPDGVGQLYQAYEQLKNKLSKEGLFNAPKKSLPKYPKRIAVVTSPSGAVIRDIITTTRRRYPIAQIVLYPAVVQGQEAADSIAAQIKQVNADGNFDTLIIGRGGGSIEDLWPFNEEIVARTIYDSKIPIISSVGHETDTTIADLVADVRAATPTAAAELAVPVLTEEINKINNFYARIINAFNNKLVIKQQRLNKLKQSYIFKQPERLYEAYLQQVDNLSNNLLNLMKDKINHNSKILTDYSYRLKINSPLQTVKDYEKKVDNNFNNTVHAMKNILSYKSNAMQKTVSSLEHLSPLKTMSRGYAYVTSENNQKVIKKVSEVHKDDEIKFNFIDGSAYAKVKSVHQKENN